MVNTTHLKVLLKKDFLTLWRNKGFLFAFAILPIGLMIAFAYIQSLVDDGPESGSLIAANFRYTSSDYVSIPVQDQTVRVNMPFMDIPPFAVDENGNPSQAYMSDIQNCVVENQSKYYFSKIAIIAQDVGVQSDAKTYFESYVFPNTGLDKSIEGLGVGFTVDTFTDQQDVFDKVQNDNDQPYCFAINFQTFEPENNKYVISYSWNKNSIPDSNLDSYNELVLAPDISSWNLWFKSGAVSLYIYMTEFVARSKASADMSSATPLYSQQVGFGPMKSNEYIQISPIGIQQLTQNFPFFFMIIYLIPFYYVTSKVAAEKESKSREGMKMMGLNDSTYFLSWFIVFFLISLITSAFITIVAAIHIFMYVNMFLFFCFCMLYSLTLFGWAFTIVSFLPTKRTSGIAATLFHVISYYLCFIITDPLTPPALQYGLSIFPNICMNQIVKQIFFYNYNTAEGLTFDTGSITYQGYSFKGGILMMFFNVVFWASLGMYLDQVVPSQFGIAKPLCFCFRRRRGGVAINQGERQRLLDDDEIGGKDRRNFEMVADSLKKQEKEGNCLKVRGLVKKFGNKTAVSGTNLTMYNGQIFALLGHNGAGKTTTISMLTGLIEPNEGCAEVFGIDIFNNMDEMRKILGVCPQHDVLFEFLTPEDHLRLFAAFKGTKAELIEDQVKKMLVDIDLVDVKDQLSKTLSGGQKRKLSVAIAMIGNSKIVMLDEPTSGMDTSARRKLWEMLKKNKAGRIVILTTHYMDEADILGDRIGIMAEGDVQCTGSSLFLKNRYGVGYNLVIAKKDRSPAPQVDKFVFDHIEGAKKMQEVSSEISYQLPTSSSNQFKNFFQQFDNNLDSLGIRSYGVGITTLEEVFLKIGHGEEVEEEKFNKLQESALKEKTPLTAEEKRLEEYTITDDAERSVFFNHTMTVMKKKVLMQVRDKKTLGIDTIFPILLIVAGLALSTIAVIKDGKAISINPQYVYPSPLTIYNNMNSAQLNGAKADLIPAFIDEAIISQSSNYSWASNFTINIDPSNPTDIFGQVSQLDDQIFDQVNIQGAGIQWGSVYINNIENTKGSAFKYSSVLLLNSTSQSVASAYGAMMHTAYLKDYLIQNGFMAASDDFSLEFIDQPFPLSKQFQAVVSTAAGTTSGILMTIAWMMISDSLVQNIIKEKQSQVKHQMMISGCSLSAYWMGNYIADLLFQALPALVGIAGIHLFNIDVPKVEYIFLVVVFANPAFIYAFSFLFDKDESGSLVIKMIFFLFGIIAPITISILQVVNESTQNVANILKWFFYPLPVYSLTFGYMSIANRALIQIVNRSDVEPDIFGDQVAGPSLYFLIAAVPFYWILVICFEQKLFDCGRYRNRNPQNNNNLTRSSVKAGYNPAHCDEDIVEEHGRVMKKEPVDLPVRLLDLKKTYGNVTAVENISFGLEYGECFALLGVSGAGKTTCFKSLTGEIYPTRGSVTINGHDITTAGGFESARKMIGYCPQFDAIFTGLTVLEHLQIYGSLKGIKRDLLDQLIEKAIKDMDLQDYRNIAANNLSGGNKRKMSVAMAMLGNPPLVFLDEPSTGVDPQAKRFMWNIVSKISTLRQRSAVIITTHSMEEAEALCTKMGIMVAGEFKCFGSSQHIKDKFGTGYELEVKIRTLTEQEVEQGVKSAGIANGSSMIGMSECKNLLYDNGLIDEIRADGLGAEFFNTFEQGKRVEAAEFYKWQFVETQGNHVIDFLEKKFRTFEILEHYGNNWKLKVSRDNYSIGFLFGMMEDIQKQYDISEYSVTQTTLEQIFNNFAMEAERAGGKGGRKQSLRRRSTNKKTPAKDLTTYS